MFPERLKNLRKEAGLTQKELAKILNTTQQNLALYEQGKRNPKIEIIEKLADYFQTSTKYLLGKTNIKNPDEIDLSKLDEAIDNSIGYDGKPITPEDRESIKEALIIYLESLKK